MNRNNRNFLIFILLSFFFVGSPFLFAQESDSSAILFSARLGGDYLLRSLNSKGRFVYRYDPKQDKVFKGYNLVRHAGTIYTLLELYEVTKETRLLKGSKKALDYLISFAKPCFGDPPQASCIVEKKKIKLGGNALAVIALAKHFEVSQDKRYVPILLRLVESLLLLQKKDGDFKHQLSYDGLPVLDFRSKYYSGEALLALVRAYSLFHDKRFLEAAEKGASYLIQVRDKGVSLSKQIHDHWLLYALNELHRYRSKALYKTHALKIAKAIIQSQNLDPNKPDLFGSFGDTGRTTQTTTQLEGLCAAYQLIQDYGNPKDSKMILESIKLGIPFILKMQVHPSGGFRRDLNHFEIRIDYVRHAISSLLGWYRISRTF